MSITNQISTDIAEISNYIHNIIKAVTRATYMEVALSNSIMIIIADNTVLYHIDLTGKIDPNINLGFHNSYDNFSQEIIDNNLINTLFAKYKEINMVELYNNKIYEDNNLRDDETFEKCLGNKATDGAEFYFVNASNCTPFFPVFSGLPIISKDDKIKLSLYDKDFNGRNHIILINMEIYKKKLNFSYNLYYNILDVNRPLR